MLRPNALPVQGLDKFSIEKDIAAYIKKEFDARHGPTWHCIVGRNFGGCWAWGAALPRPHLLIAARAWHG